MKCGVLAYLHIGKTGGTSLTQHLTKQAPKANFSFHEVWWGPPPKNEFYNFFEDDAWLHFRKAVYEQDTPKAVLALHHGVPGIGNYLWDAELKPMKKMLNDKGCELRMTTTLREPVERATSSFNFAVQLNINGRYPKLATSNSSNVGIGCAISTYSDFEASDDCVCSFAIKTVSAQVATILYGHLQAGSVHPMNSTAEVVGIPNQTDAKNPLAHLGMGVANLSSVWAARAAAVLDETMDTVGCTDHLPHFAAQLDNMLGVPHVDLGHVNPSHYNTVLTDVGNDCLTRANQADLELYKKFCTYDGGGSTRGTPSKTLYGWGEARRRVPKSPRVEGR
jgi:hypothetical protein